MQATARGLLLGGLLIAGPAAAYDPYDPANCNGVSWDDKRPLVVSAVTAKSRVNFVKSPYDDDFKAETCPAATDVCRKKSYLMTGGPRAHRRHAGPVHLHFLPFTAVDEADLGYRMAAERSADTCCAHAGAEDIRLGRHLTAR